MFGEFVEQLKFFTLLAAVYNGIGFFTGGSVVKNMLAMQKLGILGQVKSPGAGDGNPPHYYIPNPVFLPRNFHGQTRGGGAGKGELQSMGVAK